MSFIIHSNFFGCCDLTTQQRFATESKTANIAFVIKNVSQHKAKSKGRLRQGCSYFYDISIPLYYSLVLPIITYAAGVWGIIEYSIINKVPKQTILLLFIDFELQRSSVQMQCVCR